MLNNYNKIDQLGKYLGSGIFENEIYYVKNNEFVIEKDDFIWRRTKLGMELTKEENESLNKYFK